ncbi:unnamed protein product [Blepharisma stoltei]|uniref:Uncharacterized protein n=1 Tax=Blepharisma stoltei TaxID=1481888 RepID=A0AAU9IXW0_9CILI|nr:unnamed protein product [Blepharisma stoltei]
MPLLLKENDNSTIFKVVENLSKNYLANTNILGKLDSLFNTNLGISCTSSCKVCDSSSGACITCYDATHMEIKNGICYCTDPNAAFFPPTNFVCAWMAIT